MKGVCGQGPIIPQVFFGYGGNRQLRAVIIISHSGIMEI